MNNICYQNSFRIFFTFLYFPPPAVLWVEMWRAYSSGWKQFQAYIVQFCESLSLYCLWSVQMALELGMHCLLVESILGPDGCILFSKYRHFPCWIPHLTTNLWYLTSQQSEDLISWIIFVLVVFCLFSVWPQDWQFRWRFSYICPRSVP